MSNSTVPSYPMCVKDGDHAWVLLSTILVLGMMPALAFFEAGLLRRKNALSVITQVLSGLVVLFTMWFFVGFSFVYGPDHKGMFGDFSYSLLYEIDKQCLSFAPTIPGLSFALFEGMFASITPLLMTGTFAERMRFRAVMWFFVFWEIIVYYPVAHWMWGRGWLDTMGALDFAGGIVIHTSAGASSLVVAAFLGKRLGFDEVKGEFKPHNIPLATVGAALLWMGWFGFNAGSALSSGPLASYAVSTTTIASCTSTCVWILLSIHHHNKIRTIDVLNGAIAGLAGITPASGYIAMHYAALLGAILGLGSFFGVVLIKEKLEIDDALDVSSVHGLTGVIGSIGIGFFADTNVNPAGDNGLTAGGGPRLLGLQILAVIVVGAWAAFWTYILLKVYMLVSPHDVKVTDHEQEMGLDRAEHVHEAYYDDEFEVIVAEESGNGTSDENHRISAPNGAPLTSTSASDSEPNSVGMARANAFNFGNHNGSSRQLQDVIGMMDSPRLNDTDSPRRPAGLIRFTSRSNLFKGTRISASPLLGNQSQSSPSATDGPTYRRATVQVQSTSPGPTSPP